jgi:sulfonate transport system substrate-binding protein
MKLWRTLLILLLPAVLTLNAGAAEDKVVRIGYQKYGTLVLLKARGDLERRLTPQGIRVKWSEFPGGPQLLEALNVGSLDFGTTGEAPPIFAQAAGADLVYVANQPPAPSAEAIVVPKDSPLHTVAELKGKRVALNKGSNVHYLLVRALQAAGLKYSDIEPVFLAPADARAAFSRGAVDAWAIWDPFLASAEKTLGARVIANGSGIVSNHQFFLATRSFATQQADVLAAIVEELHGVDQWGEKNPAEVAKVLGQAVGVDAPTAEYATARFAFGAAAITPQVGSEQQKIADVFADLKLIPKSIRISDALLPAGAASARR